VCVKVSGKERLKWDLSAFNMSKLQSAPVGRRDGAAPHLYHPQAGSCSAAAIGA